MDFPQKSLSRLWNIIFKMSPRKYTGDKKNNDSLCEKKAVANKKNMSNSRDGFFVKSSHKNKKNMALDVIANRKNKSDAIQKDFDLKKEKQTRLQQDPVDSERKIQPFDKKAWRFKRYSKKFKLEQWKDARKTNLLRRYDKTNEGNVATLASKKKYSDKANTTQEDTSPEKEPYTLSNNGGTTSNVEKKSVEPEHKSRFGNKRNPMSKEKEAKQVEYLKRKAAKEKAMKEYKRKKLEKFKKLSRKTKKGQPVMKDRIEVLLEEIQNSMRQ